MVEYVFDVWELRTETVDLWLSASLVMCMLRSLIWKYKFLDIILYNGSINHFFHGYDMLQLNNVFDKSKRRTYRTKSGRGFQKQNLSLLQVESWIVWQHMGDNSMWYCWQRNFTQTLVPRVLIILHLWVWLPTWCISVFIYSVVQFDHAWAKVPNHTVPLISELFQDLGVYVPEVKTKDHPPAFLGHGWILRSAIYKCTFCTWSSIVSHIVQWGQNKLLCLLMITSIVCR